MDKYRQNLHTHTVFCDGSNTPEELVLKAIELGFDTIGFSGHSYTGLDIDWHMSRENTKIYKQQIDALKEKYSDKIDILCGLEFDIFSDCDVSGYDYLIGSSHFIKVGNEYFGVDDDADTVRNVINDYFEGDGMKYAKAYYENIAQLYKYGNFDIVGHFDLVAKYCETNNFFDVDSKEYKNAALNALYELANKIKVFEVNTGAVARGYRTTPYPAPFILENMSKIGCTVVLTSDCHDKNFLDYYYKEAIEYIKSCGFESVGIMKDGAIREIKIR